MVRTALHFLTHPKDAVLAFHMARFIARVPRLLAEHDLPTMLERVREERFVPRAGFDRIRRMRGACLRFPALANRNTCYVRALTLYRYLDAPTESLGLHIGIEHHHAKHTRLHGHAWVTVAGRVLEAPPEVLDGRIHEIPLKRAAP